VIFCQHCHCLCCFLDSWVRQTSDPNPAYPSPIYKCQPWRLGVHAKMPWTISPCVRRWLPKIKRHPKLLWVKFDSLTQALPHSLDSLPLTLITFIPSCWLAEKQHVGRNCYNNMCSTFFTINADICLVPASIPTQATVLHGRSHSTSIC
jgi:hypothetical protein